MSAFFGVSGKWKLYTGMELIIGIANTSTGVLGILKNGLRGGKLTILNSNLVTGMLFILIAAAVMIRKLMEKKDDVS